MKYQRALNFKKIYRGNQQRVVSFLLKEGKRARKLLWFCPLEQFEKCYATTISAFTKLRLTHIYFHCTFVFECTFKENPFFKTFDFYKNQFGQKVK